MVSYREVLVEAAPGETIGRELRRRYGLSPARLASLQADGFGLDEILYHGSNAAFAAFDRRHLRTADHFYTAPDPRTAAYYGHHVYACLGRQDPQADLTGESVESAKLVRTLAETFADEFFAQVESDEDLAAIKQRIAAELLAAHHNDHEYTPFDAGVDAEDDPQYREAQRRIAVAFVEEVITAGDDRIYGTRGRFQDNVMAECFAMNYRSVRFFDRSHTGDPVSVVFNHASDVVIIGET